MLVDIGEPGRFFIEIDQIETIQDYGTRHGCEIMLTSGRRVQSDSSASTIQAKIEQARRLEEQKALIRAGRA